MTKSDLKFFSYLVTKVHLKAAIRFLLEFEYFYNPTFPILREISFNFRCDWVYICWTRQSDCYRKQSKLQINSLLLAFISQLLFSQIENQPTLF